MRPARLSVGGYVLVALAAAGLGGCLAPDPGDLDEVGVLDDSIVPQNPVCDGKTTFRTRYLRPNQAQPVKATNRAEAQLACARLLMETSKPQAPDAAVRCPGCALGVMGCPIVEAMVRRVDVTLERGQWFCAPSTRGMTAATISWRCGACGAAACKDNLGCARDQYCAKRESDCAGAGACKERPVGCPRVLDPVCGCDGQTYSNDCIAAAAGVNVARRGECPARCCDPAQEPGKNGNPFCFEGASCCADGKWACNDAMAKSTCAQPGRVCPAPCCDPAKEPGKNGNPACFEGASCCADGNWACNNAMGKPSCRDLGRVCAPGPGCKSNADCAANTHFCNKKAGDCGGVGQCAERPQVCPDVWAPVCGCDGKTYSNGCDAAASGVSVAQQGECKPPGCRSNADCAALTHYCAKAAGDCGGAGQCAPRPQACIKIFDPVCGCNGKTYGNSCEAAAAGENVAHKGECKPPCAVDGDCPAGQVCELDTGCMKPMICVPGCHQDAQCPKGQLCQKRQCLTCPCPGVCEPPPACKTNADCAANTHYCSKAAGDCDGAGQCAARPQACIQIFDPVCGCDGKTYGNSCEAAVAGVNVRARGECAQAQLKWWKTCGDPVCRGWTPKMGVPLCQGQKPGDACRVKGELCDPQDGCNALYLCDSVDPTLNGCPISKAIHKRDIRYLNPVQLAALHDELVAMKLATYRYKEEPACGTSHLGFIIDDVAPSPSVRPDGERVDLYGYTSMAVAAVQVQSQRIEALERELAALRKEIAKSRR